MIFVEDDEIPVDLVHPLVRRLDAARFAIVAEIVLERAETDDGTRLVRSPILFVRSRLKWFLRAADELPALEVEMRQQILPPGALHRRLEGQHKNPLRAKTLRKLIRGKGLPETHLRVPEEFRRPANARLLRRPRIVADSFLDGLHLLGPHRKIKGSPFCVAHAVAHRQIRRPQRFDRTPEPLGRRSVCPKLLVAHLYQLGMDTCVAECATIGVQRAFGENDAIRFRSRFQNRELLRDTRFNRFRGEPDLEAPRQLGIVLFIRIDHWMRIRPCRKEGFFSCHHSILF